VGDPDTKRLGVRRCRDGDAAGSGLDDDGSSIGGGLERTPVGGLDRAQGCEVPVEDDAVALAGAVHAVQQRAVEVRVVVGDGRARLVEIEVEVAAHERVGRPADARRAVCERPGPLELLQGEPERPVLEARVDAVMCECRWIWSPSWPKNAIDTPTSSRSLNAP